MAGLILASGIAYAEHEDELILITQQGNVLRMDTKDIRPIGRATQQVLRLNGIDAQDPLRNRGRHRSGAGRVG